MGKYRPLITATSEYKDEEEEEEVVKGETGVDDGDEAPDVVSLPAHPESDPELTPTRCFFG